MKNFKMFELEWEMAKWDRNESYNLSESGISPITIRELIGHDENAMKILMDTPLDYSGQRGSLRLRETICKLYKGASQENILPTSGASEANFLVLTSLLEAGDHIVLAWPNYPQIFGIATNMGLKVTRVNHNYHSDWSLDIESLNRAVTPATKLIAVCNPNNPTGHIMTQQEIKEIVRAAERVGAWILSDEVYIGSELNTDTETPSLFGTYDKVLAINSLSKTYGIAGFRLGWIAGPSGTISEILKRKQYTTITTSMISDQLVAWVIEEGSRMRIIGRTRKIIREGRDVLLQWLEKCDEQFEAVLPDASGVTFVKYHMDINSTDFMKELYKKHRVTLLAGDFFDLDGFLRISFGRPTDYIRKGLDIVQQFVTNRT